MRIQAVAASLTERDQRICSDLLEHRVLTTIQLFELHFGSYNRARDRLLHLYRMGVLWRTRPRRRRGSLPFHYVLDDLGALVVAESRGVDLAALGYYFYRTLGMVESPRLQHLREINSFFSRLAHTCRLTAGRYSL
ncbi:MAG TPA: replication-relaxation family protein, partial [Actinomycetota bacterium]|nr:replication-relaxation family protein [Actinomycetota bacterium]